MLNDYMITKNNLKLKILTLLIIIIGAGFGAREYEDYKISQENIQKNVREVEAILTENNFSEFYEKQGNEFCATAESQPEQENVIDDMLWTLNDVRVQEIKKIECRDGSKGILVK